MSKKIANFLSAAVIAIIGVSVCACMPGAFRDDMMCTEIGCSDMLSVKIRYENNAVFVDGAYLFAMASIDGQGMEVTCELAASELTCADAGGDVSVEKNDGPTEFTLRLLTDWWLRGIEVAVERDGILLGQNTFYPEYQIVTPNGPECEPTCFQSSITFDLEIPQDSL